MICDFMILHSSLLPRLLCHLRSLSDFVTRLDALQLAVSCSSALRKRSFASDYARRAEEPAFGAFTLHSSLGGVRGGLLLALSLLLASPCFAQKKSQKQNVIHIESGLVQGINQESTKAFLGIPYAKVERFMPPLPVEPWDTIMVCDHWGPQAMQNVGNRKLSESEMSENSCVLNVWTTNFNSKKPVMLWLHGGGFDSGTSTWNPGMGLAKKDVVVVSINHRLNILGFLDLSACSPKYKYSGNVGMIDVIAALKWIHKNIHLFGGDPSNITVFGESGGGGKVGTLLCMPEAKNLFHKAIILSGTILNVNNKEMAESLGKAVLDELGIDKDHIDRIKTIPYNELYAAGQRAMAKSIGTRKPGTPMMWGFGPTPDGEVLMQQPFQPGFAQFADNKPIIIGTTFNELQPLTYNNPLSLDEARKQLEPVFGADTDEYITAFDNAWPNHSVNDLLSADRLFRPKTIITADYVSTHRQTPLYMYMFTWKSPVNQGSVHGHELKFCFNTLHHSPNELPSPTEDDFKLADIMSTSWANFAHTGNPNTEGLPLWQPYTKDNGEMMIFDHNRYVRHNPDRKLEEIINRNCFKQLEEFNHKAMTASTQKKALVLYYSQTATTKVVAEEIQKALNADIDSIVAVEPYSGNYGETIARCQKEMAENIMPKIKPINADLTKYDTIFLGYPIWFGTYARPMLTFIKEAKLEGKTIIPFCTFGSGGLNTTEESLKSDQPGATILHGYGVRTARIESVKKEIDRFLKEQNFISGDFTPLAPFGEQKQVSDDEKNIFDEACGNYQFPLGTPVTVASRSIEEGTEYMFTVSNRGQDGKEATSTIFVIVAKGKKPEFTQVVR